MELILLLKQQKYFAESFDCTDRKELLDKLSKINYIDGKFDEYELQKLVRDDEVDEQLEFSVHIKDNDSIYSVEEYLKK